MINKTQHRKLQIEQSEPTEKSWMNSSNAESKWFLFHS